MFFQDWFSVLRALAVGVPAYAAVVFWMRISGKRTLSKWNAFDFIVTIALGSVLATIIMSKDVSLAEGIVALGLLVGLQFALTWLSVWLVPFKKLIKGKATLLLDNGEFLPDAMRRERVTESEILAAIRSKGIAAVEEIEAVVLETDGTFSVIKKSAVKASRSALRDVS